MKSPTGNLGNQLSPNLPSKYLAVTAPQHALRALVQMSPEARHRVVRRVTQSGALPVSRDAPGYAAVLKLLGAVDAGTNGDNFGSASNGEAAMAGETAGVYEEICACD